MALLNPEPPPERRPDRLDAPSSQCLPMEFVLGAYAESGVDLTEYARAAVRLGVNEDIAEAIWHTKRHEDNELLDEA